MKTQGRLLFTLLFLLSIVFQASAQVGPSASNCGGCKIYSESELQALRDAYEPHIERSNLKMPKSFKNPDVINGAKSDLSNKGTEFWLAFNSNFTNAGVGLFLDITSDVNTSGMVSIAGISFSQSYTVTANTITRITVPVGAIVSSSLTVQSLGIHVTANDPVTVYGTNQIQFTTDAFLGLPVSILGTQHLAIAYTAQSSANFASQITIVSPYDNNVITITPSKATLGGYPAGVPFNVSLNTGQTYAVKGQADLTGSIIESTLPISVFSGAGCVNIPVGFGYCDHIVQQVPSLSTWGETFVTRPLQGRNNGDTWRFLASQDNTEVLINGASVATLNFGDFFETMLTVASYVEASNPILAVQYSNGNEWDGNSYLGDPFMMIIPPYQQFLEGYTFSTPADGFINNYFTSTVENAGVSGMMLNGAPLNAASFSGIPTTLFSAGAFPIGINVTNNLSNASSYASGLYVYGFNADDSYGYPGGLSLLSINEGSGPEIELTSATLDLFCVSNASTVDLTIEALITDPEAPFVSSAKLYYRITGTTDYNEVALNEGVDNLWTATVSAEATEFPGMDFYIWATDGQINATSPLTNPINEPYSIGIDNLPPQITHSPISQSLAGADIFVAATATDNSNSVASVNLYYRVPGGTPFYAVVNMANVGGDAYEATIPGAAMTVQGLEYYIKATDDHGVSCTYGTADMPLLITEGSDENQPPVPVGFPVVSPTVAVGDTYSLSVSFESPEADQITDLVVNDGGLPGFSAVVVSGNVATVDIELVAAADNLGNHTIVFVATDNGDPVASTTVELQISVYDPAGGQTICIPQGWSGVSSYLDPANPDMVAIFADLKAEGKVEFVLGKDGFYWPSQNINTLSEGWDVKQGYKVKMNEEGCLDINGAMPADKSFEVSQGVSFAPVLCSEAVEAEDLLSQFGNDLRFAFDIYSQQVYWPEGGLYTLQQLEPGKAYMLNMIAAGQAEYTCSKASSNLNPNKPVVYNNAPWNYTKTGALHLIAIQNAGLSAVNDGDFIGVFNQAGLCVGLTRYDAQTQNQLLVAYGDDMTTTAVDGLVIEETMEFRVYHIGSHTEAAINVQFSNTMANSGTFQENGQSIIIKAGEAANAVGDMQLDMISISPNPGNGLFNINLPLVDQSLQLEVMNISGQLIFADEINNATGGIYQLRLMEQTSGVFFVKITSQQQTIIRKVVIQ